jgi:hypothetical protein
MGSQPPASAAEMGLGVVQRFRADLRDAPLAGEGFGVASSPLAGALPRDLTRDNHPRGGKTPS